MVLGLVLNLKLLIGRSTICSVQDTGGFNKLNRVLDLSYGSFSKIAPVNQGLVRVRIDKVK